MTSQNPPKNPPTSPESTPTSDTPQTPDEREEHAETLATAQNISQDLPQENNTKEDPAEDIKKYIETESTWTNIILGLTFLTAAYVFTNIFYEDARIKILFMIILMIIHAFLTMLRTPPATISTHPQEWLYAITGTWLPVLILSLSIPNEIASLFILQIIMTLFTMAALITLGKSYGVVPAQRQIKTGGLYRVVRHPIYFGYLVCCTCAVAQNINSYTASLLALMLGVHVMSIFSEEKILSADPRYTLYQSQTRKKLIPFIW